MSKLWQPGQKFNVDAPRNAADRKQLCGVAIDEIEPYWDSSAAADNHSEFVIAGQTQERQKTVRLWLPYKEATGQNPDTTPQPTGNCVAAAADDVLELLQALAIMAGKRRKFRSIHSSFHYATGRVLIGKNRLRGRPGSIGGWQAAALEQFGATHMELSGLPDYTKKFVDAWGDDRKALGKSFRDFMDPASTHIVGSTARVKPMEGVFDSLSNLHPMTIAGSFGYSMKPGRDGYHEIGKPWSHQMSLWGYSIPDDWVAIKNQWGRAVHGQVIEPGTGLRWPPGFLCVRLSDFARHLRVAECIAFSRFKGFPEQRFDHTLVA